MHMKRLTIILFYFVLSHGSAQSPNLILINGKIFTADVGHPYVEALAIKGNVITAIGTNAEIEKMVVAKTKRIDLKGKTVVPGFNSAHEHHGFNSPVGLQYNIPELTAEGPTKQALLVSIGRLVKKGSPNQWVHGRIGTTVLYDKDMGLLMMHTPKYGRQAMLRSLLEEGVLIGISPDGTTNPFLDILRVTTGMSDPHENITREDAVIAFTKTNAYAEFEEDQKGTLTPGKLADLTVLSQDIFLVPPEQLRATYSELTMVDGKVVYSH